jgi:hypothetical protein
MATLNDTPYEIIAAPFTLWLAATGTAFPVVDAAPAGTWTKIGSSGALNYDEGGVSIEHSQSVSKWRPLGSAAPTKAFRTEEDLTISLVLHDLTLEQYAFALNGGSVTTVAAGSGTAGYKSLPLTQGLLVTRYALLVRGVSPYGDFTGQYEVPIVVHAGTPSVVYTKGEPAGLALKFEALRDTSLGLGTLRMQTAAAL